MDRKLQSHVERSLTEFSVEHPGVEFKHLRGDTPEARDAIAEMLIGGKNPTQIVVYESEMQGPYTREQWPHHAGFIKRAFEMEAFNKIFYMGPTSGAHIRISGVADLDRELDCIAKGFRINPDGTVKYALGMNIQVQGYDSEKRSFIVERNPGKFK